MRHLGCGKQLWWVFSGACDGGYEAGALEGEGEVEVALGVGKGGQGEAGAAGVCQVRAGVCECGE